ncbi:DnaT-like ssDNA-binding protein [[Pasteurella] aerogenes]
MTLNVPTDSYVSLEEANGYHQLRASFEVWNELDDEQKARRLVSASDFLDHNYRFVGEKADPTQIRQFPRESSEIPLQVKYAVCELALQSELNQNPEQKMASVKVGPVSVNYENQAVISGNSNRFEYVKTLLSRFLNSSSTNNVSLLRG